MRLVDTIKNIWKIEDLRKRILITILYVVIYRLGSFVVLPGVNPDTPVSYTHLDVYKRQVSYHRLQENEGWHPRYSQEYRV